MVDPLMTYLSGLQLPRVLVCDVSFFGDECNAKKDSRRNWKRWKIPLGYALCWAVKLRRSSRVWFWVVPQILLPSDYLYDSVLCSKAVGLCACVLWKMVFLLSFGLKRSMQQASKANSNGLIETFFDAIHGARFLPIPLLQVTSLALPFTKP